MKILGCQTEASQASPTRVQDMGKEVSGAEDKVEEVE